MKNLILLVFSILFLIAFITPVIKEVKMNKEKAQVCSEEVSMAFNTPQNEMDLVRLTLTPITFECNVLKDSETGKAIKEQSGVPSVSEKPPIQVNAKAINNIVSNVENAKFTKENYKQTKLTKDFDFSYNKLL